MRASPGCSSKASPPELRGLKSTRPLPYFEPALPWLVRANCGERALITLRPMLSVAAAFAALIIYSIALIAVELGSSQAAVRPYFADIEGSVPFFAVNTSLSASLLAGAALLLLFAYGNLHGAKLRVRAFLLAQSALFGLLAMDDRFQLHEIISYRLGLEGDHYVMLSWGLMELALLLSFFRIGDTSRGAMAMFAGAGLFAGIMLIFDIFVPSAMPLRLSIEDLAKTWGAAMFLGFSWQTAGFHLRSEARVRTAGSPGEKKGGPEGPPQSRSSRAAQKSA